jgi:hypothetical protein
MKEIFQRINTSDVCTLIFSFTYSNNQFIFQFILLIMICGFFIYSLNMDCAVLEKNKDGSAHK